MSYTKIHPVIDLTGKKFNRLTVLEYSYTNKWSKDVWKCKCDCGNIVYHTSYELRTGKVKSCRCLQRELAKERHTKHNSCSSRIYCIYHNMKARCYRKTSHKYKNYGGRGIQICDEWLGENGYSTFEKWALSNGYSDSLTIDRIDVNGNYEPNNCRWIPLEEQATNRTNSVFVTIDGITKTLSQWSRDYNINMGTVQHRVKKMGWDYKTALKTPTRKEKTNV